MADEFTRLEKALNFDGGSSAGHAQGHRLGCPCCRKFRHSGKHRRYTRRQARRRLARMMEGGE